MIKIIDVGYLRDERVEAYLKDDVNNLLAFTVFACMEALKADYNSKNFRETFIDKEQTLTFPEFCIRVSRVDDSDTEFAKNLLEKSQRATECLDGIADNAALMLKAITAYSREMDKGFLKNIRTGKKWKIDEYQYVCTQVLEACKKIFQKKINETQLPTKENFLNHYIFRYTLSCFLLVLKWLTDRGWTSHPAEKVRNDTVDMSYVAFATYFDGVLSKDKKINSIYPKVIDFLGFLKNNSPNNKMK
jgi:hypothetical protein